MSGEMSLSDRMRTAAESMGDAKMSVLLTEAAGELDERSKMVELLLEHAERYKRAATMDETLIRQLMARLGPSDVRA